MADKMFICKETTMWDAGYPVRNHTYALNKAKDRMFGYLKSGETEWTWFPAPRKFDARYRKFDVLEERKDFARDV